MEAIGWIAVVVLLLIVAIAIGVLVIVRRSKKAPAPLMSAPPIAPSVEGTALPNVEAGSLPQPTPPAAIGQATAGSAAASAHSASGAADVSTTRPGSSSNGEQVKV